ncbi:c-type cytochrome domain-containing protein [Botrimarina sp.]|uniref:c-type cytochrome domain-containing protein n=1 Tax=Botrimarina sp. TaxID=2795802 RepID=UPI0032ED406E
MPLSHTFPARAALAAGLLTIGSAAICAEKVTFDDHVRPILREHCAGCHNQDDAASDLALDNYDGALAGGAGGESLAPGDPDGSRLWLLITGAEEPAMPPGGDKLPEAQLAVIRAWIEGGLLENKDSKAKASRKPAVAAVEAGPIGEPEDPAVPDGVFRQPVVTAPTPGPVDAVAASPWAAVAAVAWQRQASLYDVASGELLGVLPYLDGAVRVVRFSRDGSLLLVAGGRPAAAGTAALYDVESGARLATVGDEVDAVLAADLRADNAAVAIGGPNKKVRAYRVADGETLYTCEKHTDWITALAYSPDGRLLATADRAGGLRLWQADGGHERADLRGHKAAVTAVAWRRDAGLLASTSEDGALRLWSADGAPIKAIDAHPGGAMAVSFAPDGRLVSTGRDKTVKLWKPDGAAAGEVAKLDDIGLSVAFTHDGARVVASDWTGAVRLIDIESKAAAAELAPNPPTLAERLTAAEGGLAQQQAARDAAARELEKAERALATAEQQHAEHDARIAEAELALADAAESLADAQAQVEAADGAVAEGEASEALDEAGPDPQQLADAVATATQERDAAERRLATLANQSAGLPDLAPLRAAVNRCREAAAQAARAYDAAVAARDAAAAEAAAYAASGERLTGEVAAATAAAEAAERHAQALAKQRDEAAGAADAAGREVAELESQLARLRERLTAARAVQSEASQASSNAQSQSAAADAALATALRERLRAESLLDTVRAVEEFRAERAADASR